jgi:hypothetical protein
MACIDTIGTSPSSGGAAGGKLRSKHGACPAEAIPVFREHAKLETRLPPGMQKLYAGGVRDAWVPPTGVAMEQVSRMWSALAAVTLTAIFQARTIKIRMWKL